MKVGRLRRVQKLILGEPRRFNMAWFAAGKGCGTSVVERQQPPCGTVACIAGWAAIEEALEGGRKRLTTAFIARLGEVEGRRALGLTVAQAERLFYTENWPSTYGYRYLQATCADDYVLMAQVAAERIDHFIKTQGAE